MLHEPPFGPFACRRIDGESYRIRYFFISARLPSARKEAVSVRVGLFDLRALSTTSKSGHCGLVFLGAAKVADRVPRKREKSAQVFHIELFYLPDIDGATNGLESQARA